MPRGGAVERLNQSPASLENINGKSGFACPVGCANGRTGKAGLAGGAGEAAQLICGSTSPPYIASTVRMKKIL
ncbi:hypothetical protein PFLUV_G00019230 [Perca fluviatilis]|uniref:Uncharacterized protein n=1 Tax=Perca fluviatilis TaxID=8168 RepID=A0A6A5EVN8_PERFL|nr:hypothetical protein PFLUV_G00019230 [Perca fluviatilis]